MSERPTIIIGEEIISKLRSGEAVELDAVTILPASDFASTDALRARVAKLEAALGGLVERLDEINAHPEFKSVWTLHHVHGGRYSGPNWVEPLEAARAVLSEAIS